MRWISWFQALDDNYDNTALVMRFKDYVTEIWVEWHLDLWNHFDHNGPRTINAFGEGTTSSKCVAYVPPNGFVFVEMLRKEQATANTASEFVCPKKRKHRQLDTWLQSLEDRPRHWMLLPILFISSESCKYLCVNNVYMISVIVIWLSILIVLLIIIQCILPRKIFNI